MREAKTRECAECGFEYYGIRPECAQCHEPARRSFMLEHVEVTPWPFDRLLALWYMLVVLLGLSILLWVVQPVYWLLSRLVDLGRRVA